MAVPNVENLSIEILNNMRNNIQYSRKDIIDEQKRILLITKKEENRFKLTIGFAITRLVNLGFINRVNRGIYVITDLGIEQLKLDKEELKEKIIQYNTKIGNYRNIAYKLFEEANEQFLKYEKVNIKRNVSERNLCQNLANYLRDNMKKIGLEGYYADTEYDRNQNMVKTIINNEMKIIEIECDLIVHSRGENVKQDNLIAIEMKKSTNMQKRNEDKERLKYMTKNTYYNEITYQELPRHICRYALGIFYDINIEKQKVNLEYYENGKLCKEKVLKF